jgi:thioester reductase-like protein
MNPYDDGVSLDVFVDWLIRAGNKIQRIDDYDEWLARFQTALTGLPERQRQHSILPAVRRPAVGNALEQLFAAGLQQRGDVEYNLGQWIGKLSRTTTN